MRIAVIGPVPPFRGGIALHTMMLARALVPLAEVQVISFTRQYPGWLYPGASDVDRDAAPMSGAPCRYLLDSLDPRSWHRTVEAVTAFGAGAVVIPWWSAYWAPCVAWLARRFSRLGIPVHFVCHNVSGHDAPPWQRALARWALRRGRGFVVQSEAERAALLHWMPDARTVVSAHPAYVQYPEPRERPERRAALELLFFGFVRRYKGVDLLLQALPAIRDRDFVLTIAGEIWEQREQLRALAAAPELAGRVEFLDRYAGVEEAARLFARADAVVLPYRSATGSGVLGLSYRYGVPVIASRVAGLAEFVVEGKTGLLVAPGSVESLAATLRAISAESLAAMRPAAQAATSGMTWEALAGDLMSIVAGGGEARG